MKHTSSLASLRRLFFAIAVKMCTEPVFWPAIYVLQADSSSLASCLMFVDEIWRLKMGACSRWI